MDIHALRRKEVQQIKSNIKSYGTTSTTTSAMSHTTKARKVGRDLSPLYLSPSNHNLQKLRPQKGTSMGDLIHTLEIRQTLLEEKVNLNWVFSLLACELYTDLFYGITVSIEDEFINISNPVILKHIIDSVVEGTFDPELNVFDSVSIFSYVNAPVLRKDKLVQQYQILQNIITHIVTSNSSEYVLDVTINDTSTIIKETYGGSAKFTVVFPVHTCRYLDAFYPYYGFNLVDIQKGEPTGSMIHPITSPNIDVFETRIVCTGNNVKLAPALSANQGANFNSGYRHNLSLGTLGAGYREAIAVQINESRELLKLVYDDIEYTNPTKELLLQQEGEATTLMILLSVGAKEVYHNSVSSHNSKHVSMLKALMYEVMPMFDFPKEDWEAFTYNPYIALNNKKPNGDKLLLGLVSFMFLHDDDDVDIFKNIQFPCAKMKDYGISKELEEQESTNQIQKMFIDRFNELTEKEEKEGII